VEDFIRKYYFCNEEEPMTIPARMTENIHGGEGRETFTMVRLRKTEAGWEAEPIHAEVRLYFPASLRGWFFADAGSFGRSKQGAAGGNQGLE
jgi:hypothetical protein